MPSPRHRGLCRCGDLSPPRGLRTPRVRALDMNLPPGVLWLRCGKPPCEGPRRAPNERRRRAISSPRAFAFSGGMAGDSPEELMSNVKGSTTRQSGTINSVQNGLLLDSAIHQLFDCYIFSINPDVGSSSCSILDTRGIYTFQLIVTNKYLNSRILYK
jgi:hypothetical protein